MSCNNVLRQQTKRLKISNTLGAATLAIAAMFQPAPDKALAKPPPDPDARIMSDLFFRYIPEGTVADCLVTFTYDKSRSDPDADFFATWGNSFFKLCSTLPGMTIFV